MSRPDTSPPDLPPDLGEESALYRVIEFATRPVDWPLWRLILIDLGLIALVAGIWWGFTRSWDWVPVVIVALLFGGTDLLVITAAPKLRVSFGPPQIQFFPLQLPRLIVLILAAPLALVLPANAALGIAVFINILASLALVWGALEEPLRITRTTVALSSPKLPPGQTLRILHLSDLHLERWGEREERMVVLIQEAEADLILITGDYVNTSYRSDKETLAEVKRFLRKLKAPHGVYAVLGTPFVDYYVPPSFVNTKTTLLRDQVAPIRLDREHSLALIGVECHHNIQRDALTLADTATKADPNAYRILLYHSPELMDHAPAQDIDLYLCGHTHGGQVRLPGYGAILTASALGKRYEMGRYDKEGTTLYVSRGIGMEGLAAPRVRFLSPPEITLFEISGE